MGVRAALVDRTLVPGDVRVEDGRVAAVGVASGRDSGVGVAVPGFVDAHINGFAGVDFLTADASEHRRAAAALAATGVTAYLPTFVSAPEAAVREGLAVVGELAEGALSLPRVLGAHLEGPFLSPQWPGAHQPEHLRGIDLRLAERLCAAGPVAMMTLAPELPGALELIARLRAAGTVVSCGHSDADAPTAHRAFDAGARAITHVYNAHRRWQPRDPGIAGAALARPDVSVQAIVDDVHLAPEAAYAAYLAAYERFCLVTDAIAAAGLPPGTSQLGLREVTIRDGAARLPDAETLAGSVLTMDRAVRNLRAKGAPLAAAVHAATRAPSHLLERPDLGRLTVGAPADIAVLDDANEVVRTLVAGAEAFAR